MFVVGNIPYEATEEKLKDIFSEVGPVLSLKLVFDRESGKPKGYGFCEFKDQETALSAMRNLVSSSPKTMSSNAEKVSFSPQQSV